MQACASWKHTAGKWLQNRLEWSRNGAGVVPCGIEIATGICNMEHHRSLHLSKSTYYQAPKEARRRDQQHKQNRQWRGAKQGPFSLLLEDPGSTNNIVTI